MKVFYARIEDLDKVTAEVERLKWGIVKFLIGPRSEWPSYARSE
jgi:hypothetical protein